MVSLWGNCRADDRPGGAGVISLSLKTYTQYRICAFSRPKRLRDQRRTYSMAMTHDYLDYLEDQIGISPANSQEELQAAQTIADLMKKHDVDVNVEGSMLPAAGASCGACFSF